MIGLVYKDIMVLKKQLRYYVGFLMVYGVMAVMGVGASVMGAMISVVGLVLPMSSIAYDEQARWDKFAVSTPAGRAGVVGAKYLFTLLVLGSMTLLVLLSMAVLHLAGMLEENIADMAASALSCTGVSLLMNSVTLPLLLKFGAEKSRSISMGIFVVIFGGSFLSAAALKKQTELPVLPAWLADALPVVLAALAVGSFVISYCIARGIYEKKEL